MTKINWGRVVLGGLVAGLIINAADYLVNGVILQAWWAEVMKGLGKPEVMSVVQIAAFNISGFLMGISPSGFMPQFAHATGRDPRLLSAQGRRSGR